MLSVALAFVPATIANNCASLISPAGLASIETSIKTNPVMLFGLENYRCTMAAEESLPSKGVCFKKTSFSGVADDKLAYLKCINKASLGENMWHSYLYVDGKYVGDGFKSKSLTDFGSAKLTCGTNCDAKFSKLLSTKQIAKLKRDIALAPVSLYGWGGCPCTNIARNRFNELGVCYIQNVWPDWTDPKFKYLQCVYGEDNHSFIFFKGKFYGNGFKLDDKVTGAAELQSLLNGAGARSTCIKKGDRSLTGRTIRSCTQSTDGTTTGWTRTGSCNWDPSDGGYHEVCVTMSEEFLKSSAQNDANDLSSVVQAGGHWCICAWAFASAVERDPKHMQGIHLECDRTNSKLRGVYQHFIDEGKKLTSPSGVSYEASTALQYVDRLCGDGHHRNLRKENLHVTHEHEHPDSGL